jgi:hypothetical protein
MLKSVFETCCGGSARAMKLVIFSLIEAHFGVRSIATDSKIAEKQAENNNFWPGSLPPQQVFIRI